MTTFNSSDGAATEIPTSLPGAVDEFDRPAAQGGPRWEDMARRAIRRRATAAPPFRVDGDPVTVHVGG